MGQTYAFWNNEINSLVLEMKHAVLYTWQILFNPLSTFQP